MTMPSSKTSGLSLSGNCGGGTTFRGRSLLLMLGSAATRTLRKGATAGLGWPETGRLANADRNRMVAVESMNGVGHATQPIDEWRDLARHPGRVIVRLIVQIPGKDAIVVLKGIDDRAKVAELKALILTAGQ